MNRKWWLKTSLVIFTVVLSVLYLLPSVYNLSSFPTWAQKILPNNKLQLGLDLQGGLHIVMGIDVNKVLHEQTELSMEDLRNNLTSKTIAGLEVIRKEETILVRFSNSDDVKKIRKMINGYGGYTGPIFEYVKQSDRELTLQITPIERDYIAKRALEQSIEAVRNRIDEFGVAEPSIQSEGNERIVIQLPGIQDMERAKGVIGRTAKLEFKIVDTSKTSGELEAIVKSVEKEKGVKFETGKGQSFSKYMNSLQATVKGKIPEGTEIAFQKKKNSQTQEVTLIPYLLKKKIDVTGEQIRDARWNRDPQTNEPIVEMTFNAQGGARFAKLTEENVGKPLAIVLDGIIDSAPRISEKIPTGRARITFGSMDDPNQALKEAQDTALVLRAGALPTSIELQEERAIGPSLGIDSIKSGKKAIWVGFLLVIIFMIIYYKGSGVIANVALLLNLLFMLAAMAIFGATLTLPGLAGIVLTIGMAVDANVLIFERIREELRQGKSAKASIEAGFEKAWGTILDSNLTTIMAAVALLSEGTGPVKGFAITLTVGIICSMFTAVFVSKLIFEFFIAKFQIQKVSI